YQGEIVSVEIPASVELAITETEPGIQGDRVSGARKPATLETGLVVHVPLFINPGDRVRVDTRSGDYSTRVCGVLTTCSPCRGRALRLARAGDDAALRGGVQRRPGRRGARRSDIRGRRPDHLLGGRRRGQSSAA